MASDLISVISSADSDFEEQLGRLRSVQAESASEVLPAVQSIIDAIRQNGDAQLVKYTQEFDRFPAESIADLEVSLERCQAALASLAPERREALEFAAARLREYAQHQKIQGWGYQDQFGNQLGQQVTPLDRVGIYVPGGKASYPSSVLMNAIPAHVAGVEEIIMVSPAPGGEANELLLAAAAVAGVTKVFLVGGAQAVAALAFGTETVQPVDVITGPGNAFVAEAKRQVFGTVGIDMIAGPSEILVVADNTANADWVAADLLSQAEHDPTAQSILITDDAGFADNVVASVENYLNTLPRGEITRQSWDRFGAIILVGSVATDAGALIDRLAPEHLELCVADPEAVMQTFTNAGAIFMGHHTPEAVGDYVAGPNHVLPTARSARFSSGLSVLNFMKRSTILNCSAEALGNVGPSALKLAQSEGLPAHGLSVAVRLNLPWQADNE